MSGVHTPYVHLLCKTTTWSSWQQQSRVRREVKRFSKEVKRPTVEAEETFSRSKERTYYYLEGSLQQSARVTRQRWRQLTH